MNSLIQAIKSNGAIIKKVAVVGAVLLGGAIVKNIVKNAAYPANESYFETTITETETVYETEEPAEDAE